MAPAIRPEDLPLKFGPYLLLEQLGVGATGEVYLAKHRDLRQSYHAPIVIKRLLPDRAEDPDFVRRFRHEARIAVQVDSPHVAGVFDVGSADGVLYIAMEYVNGWNLTKLMLEIVEGRLTLDVEVALEIVCGALDGLTALHELVDEESGEPLGFVHRDVSPRNLMIGIDGAPRIIDLGIGLSRVQSWETRTGRVLGAVGYMAPEQIAGRRADQTADLYAIGVIAHELLSGKRFIEPASVHDMMRAGLRPKLERLSALRRDVPDGLEAVIERALAPEPVDRYASAREMLSAIAAVVPRERMTGKTRALVTTLFKDETEAKRARVREILGRDGSATADTGSDTSLEIFAGGVRFPMYDASQSLDTDSGDATAVAPVEDAHPIHATLRLSLEQDRGQTVLIPTIDRVDSTSQARVITRVTRVPVRPKRRWVGAAMFLVIGILLGIGSRVLLD